MGYARSPATHMSSQGIIHLSLPFSRPLVIEYVDGFIAGIAVISLKARYLQLDAGSEIRRDGAVQTPMRLQSMAVGANVHVKNVPSPDNGLRGLLRQPNTKISMCVCCAVLKGLAESLQVADVP
jgi:hypothetical protein